MKTINDQNKEKSVMFSRIIKKANLIYNDLIEDDNHKKAEELLGESLKKI